MKGNVILWTLLLTLAMTACGQNMEVALEERLPEPEIQEAEQCEESCGSPGGLCPRRRWSIPTERRTATALF